MGMMGKPFVKTACGVLVGGLFCLGFVARAAEEVDWNRYLIDGAQITRNWNRRYLSADPQVTVAISGKSQEVANSLVDGRSDSQSGGVALQAGEEVEISFDLRADRLLSGIVIDGRNTSASWEMAASRDGREWRAMPSEGMVHLTPNEAMLANLAMPARHVRMRAKAGAEGMGVRQVFIYGEERADVPVVGGIYTSWFPPVAGQEVELRAVIRNLAADPVKSLRVRFRQAGPVGKDIGETAITELAGGSAKLAVVRWTPTVTEPCEIEVSVSGDGLKETRRSEVIPVVNRRLYFSNFYPYDGERLHYTNLYTTIGGGFEYFLAKIRGRLGMYATSGVVGGNLGLERFLANWTAATKGSYRDGMAMDEWGQPNFYPEACEAIKRVCRERDGRFVVPWLNTPCDLTIADAFRNTDLILSEMYIGWRQSHYDYRRLLGQSIDGARKYGLLDKWVFALNMMDGHIEGSSVEAPTIEQREREVQYLRMRGPEMPGVAFYGGYQLWGTNTLTRQTDELCYKYFIAPVVTLDGPWEVQGDSLRATVWNIGGMTARNVVLAATDGDQRELGRAEVAMLRPEDKAAVSVRLPAGTDYPTAKVLPGPGYTELNPHVLVLIPDRQMQGLPVRVCWTPLREGEKLTPTDRLEFLSLDRGSVDFQMADPAGKGKWDGGTLHLANLSTAKLSPGRYSVRLMDGVKGKTRTSQVLTVTPANAKFYVSKVNGEPWKGDPQEIAIQPGDTFEVRWDMGEWKLPGGAGIYVSVPGEPLALPMADSNHSVARIHNLRAATRNLAEDMFVTGHWTWSSRTGPDDTTPLSADLKRIAMAANPGKWRLWIGEGDDGDMPAKPLLVTPMVTVTVAALPGTAGGTQAAGTPVARRVADPNRVANPGFEVLGPNNMPVGWIAPGNEGGASVDTGNGCQGKNCMHFKLDGKQMSFAQEQPFPVTPGRVYILSAMIKTRDFQTKCPYGVLLTNVDWTWGSPPLTVTAPTSDWKEYTVRFQVPADVKEKSCRVRMYWDKDIGDVWVDNVRLIPDPAADNTPAQ